MDEPPTDSKVLKLRRYFREDFPSDDRVDTICELIRTSNFDPKRDGLPLVRLYIRNCNFPNVAILKQMAIAGFFNVQDSLLQSPLHWIIAECDVVSDVGAEEIKAIIKNGADPNLTDFEGNNVLHLASAMKVGTSIIKAILKGQPKPSPLVIAKNKQGWTPMRILVSRDEFLNFEQYKLLKRYGGDINEKDELGNSLLHIALSRCSRNTVIDDWRSLQLSKFREFAEMFVKLGADVNDKNDLNHVPLRLAIDLEIPLNAMMSLMPSVEILNDDSCWDGPFIDYVLRDAARKDGNAFVKAAFNVGANHVSENTLLLAVYQSAINSKLVKILLTELGCRVSLKALEEALKLKRFKALEMILAQADEDIVNMVKVRHPNILVKISKAYRKANDWERLKSAVSRVSVTKFISLLINKFGIDINYKEQDEKYPESMLLHNLVRKGNISNLRFVLAFEDLDINKTIMMGDAMETSALQYALNNDQYHIAEFLIQNFADTSKIKLMNNVIYEGMARCLLYLTALGHLPEKFELVGMYISDEDEADNNYDHYYDEVRCVKKWIRKRSKQVLTLKELSALQVRKNSSKIEITQLMANVDFPKEIEDMFFLKHIFSDWRLLEEESSDEYMSE